MKTIVIILFLTCCFVQVSIAQVIVNPNTCIMDTFRIGNSKIPLTYSTVTNHNSTVMGVNIGTVNYQIATDPTGRKHIAIDWLSLSGKNPNMSDLAIREFIINEIIRSYGAGTYNVYYKEDCIKERVCSYQLWTPIETPSCCEVSDDYLYFVPKMHSYGFPSSFKFLEVIRKEVCGFKCCYDTYTVNSGHPQTIVRGQGQGFGISATECQPNVDYHCYKDSSSRIIPCENSEGCYQWR